MQKVIEFLKSLNEKGIYIPLIRDPKAGPSVSLTLVFISFNLCLIAMIGKWSGKLGGVDPSQALNLFMVCSGLYWGRKFQKDSKGTMSVESEEKKD
jgi:hypothetical protein